MAYDDREVQGSEDQALSLETQKISRSNLEGAQRLTTGETLSAMLFFV